MKKRLITTILAMTLLVSSNSFAFAKANVIDTATTTVIGLLEVDPVPVHEGKSTRAVSLVGSDVIHYYSGFGLYSYAWGYTDVRNSDNTNAYHYTRAEVQKDGVTKATSGKVYGYGYVEAESTDCENGMTSGYVARIFWGSN